MESLRALYKNQTLTFWLYQLQTFIFAEFMSKDFAETQMHDLVNKDCGWNYYGDCLEPKAIRKIEIELF